MRKEKGVDILSLLYNIIHEKKQVEDYGVYLTIGKVFQFVGKGNIDFGDSEYKESEIEEITPLKKNREDKYGWWDLPHGEYLIEFNEELQELLPSAKLVILQPSERITVNGAFHSTKVIEKKGTIRVTLYVGKNGINIKKNARVSKLIVLK
jgi:deoxycytidine triphosphate deaminase